jgi:UDP-glucose 4-epimerase
VTGGIGFIGSHTVVELVTEGKNVIIVDALWNTNIKCLERINEITRKSEAVKFFEMDFGDSALLEEKIFKTHKIKSVIHFAGFKAVGESVEKPLMYYQNNVARTINLLQLMEKYDCNEIIFSSSCTVFGDGGTNDESGALGPISPYGRTKYFIE